MKSNSEVILSVRDIKTRFGEKVVHSGVSFDVKRGSITGLIGGSGTGKSVLVQEILGLLRPSGGTIELTGLDVWSISDAELTKLRQKTGVLFQNGALFSAINVRDNIKVPLIEAYDLTDSVMDLVANLKIRLSGLDEAAGDKLPSELSGGMIKRAAIARALALEPKILFLDEPTSGLDPINARAIDLLIKNLSRNLDLTVLVITHDVLTLRSIVDHLIVLYDGKVLVEGSYGDVTRNPHPWIQEYFSRDPGSTSQEDN